MGIGSTGQTELARERIADTTFVCPPERLQSAFSVHAAPLHQLIAMLLAKNENLSTTRDLLLPKLVSGEISVDAAEKMAATG
jgi:type I restriction enzyme, S subunit